MKKEAASLLGITGGSCSGKDTLVDHLELISPISFTRVDFDDYFLGTERLKGQTITDWENPALYRYSDYIRDLRSLKNGQSIEIECHSRKSVAEGVLSKVIVPKRWIVVSGFLCLFEEEAAQIFDRTVYLDLSEEEMINRRLARTSGLEGWNDQEYIQSGLSPGHRKYVLPQKHITGILVLDGTLPTQQLAQSVLELMI